MGVALSNARVLTPSGIAQDKAVLLRDGRIAGLVDSEDAPPDYVRYDLGGGWLVPGFIDTQVNGGGGVMFNDAPTVETIRAIGVAHRAFGVTGFLPTLISTNSDTIRRAIDATRQGLEEGVPGLLGLHIEGPFLNVQRKGIHDASTFRTIDQEAFELLTSLGAGRTLVTLAPEKTSPDMIQRLAAAGVIVSAGHTNATYPTIRTALAHGLRGFTHLFNAMSPLTSREPGTVGAALEDQDSWAALIVDGRHVDPVVLRLALRLKSHRRIMLVSDAMPCVGSENKSFFLDGRLITVKDGVCIDEQGTLAGSDLNMASAVRNAVTMLGLDLADAARMAGCNPAQFLRLDDDLGCIAQGYRADLVLLDHNLNVLETWIGGQSGPSNDRLIHG
jgi:N-acetylglucosamine-6-phosphate deacetylase